jgi:hypothetical protein
MISDKQQREINIKNAKDNQEIKENVGMIVTKLAVMDEKLDNIHEQSIKTNGKVLCLEEKEKEFNIQYLEMLRNIKDERKAVRNKMYDLAWRVLIYAAGIVGSIAMYHYLSL